jgi:hypothetical protein
MPLHQEISTDIMSLISLYNNAKDLIVISQKRREANDVVKAASIYARNIGIDFSDDTKEKIENFSSVLLDSRSNTLVHLLQGIVQDIVTSEMNKKIKKS